MDTFETSRKRKPNQPNKSERQNDDRKTENEENFSGKIDEDVTRVKRILPSEDVPVYAFETKSGTRCAIIYTDGMVNKQLLGDLAVRPLSAYDKKQIDEERVRESVLFPEIKQTKTPDAAAKEILDGNALLLVDTITCGVIIGTKSVPTRAVTEPQTSVVVKGPREGFIEDVKTNVTLLRKRLKTGDLRIETVFSGKRSNTTIALCYLQSVADPRVLQTVKERLSATQTDIVADSSYLVKLLAERRHTLFKEVGTTEKPDVLAAKIAEGRVGIIADGSPIALSVPYTLSEDFQSAEDYFISPFAATIFRCLRFFAAAVALLLPALYVSSQLFSLQLIPLNLTLTIAGSTRGLPLSPSLEMFLVLLVLEILKEASIRMPKYVGLALSVVGALVLGDTAVSAGFVSTPAIIVVAFSGICLYTVPDFVETGSVLRWIFLIVAGSVGPFGIVLLCAFLLYYLITADAFGAPPLAPFAPFIKHDQKDALMKADLYDLPTRPRLFRTKNRRRLKCAEQAPNSGDADKSGNTGSGGNGEDAAVRNTGGDVTTEAQKYTPKKEKKR